MHNDSQIGHKPFIIFLCTFVNTFSCRPEKELTFDNCAYAIQNLSENHMATDTNSVFVGGLDIEREETKNIPSEQNKKSGDLTHTAHSTLLKSNVVIA